MESASVHTRKETDAAVQYLFAHRELKTIRITPDAGMAYTNTSHTR